jgi:hypothetical protein
MIINSMSNVKFKHKTYGTMTTASKYWIEYEIFDAVNKIGDSYLVYRSDCDNPKVVD